MNEELLVAERQHGVLTRGQLIEHGYSDARIQRTVASGRFERIFPSVYRVVGSVPTAHQRIHAACLWLGPNAMASHETAGALLHLDGIKTRVVHVTTRTDVRGGRGHGVSVHASATLLSRDRRVVDGIPCTSAARTLFDCAGTLDDESLETAFESARRMGLVTLRTARAAVRRAPGAARMKRILRAVESRPLESKLEVKLKTLLKQSKVPASVPQYPVSGYRLDRAWPEHSFALEADGFQFHGRRLQWKRDRKRIATIEARGWRIMHVTWDDVTVQPAQTLDRIAWALGTMAA